MIALILRWRDDISRGMVLFRATMQVAVDAAIVEMVWVLITVVR